MQTEPTSLDLELFFRQVRAAPKRALLLDYDGTLAPFRVERDAAVPYPGVRDQLNTILAAGHTRMVIISGRAVHDVWRLINLAAPIEIWGCHGAERLLPDDSYAGPNLSELTAGGLARAAAWAERHGFVAHCERKPASIAFHWRGESLNTARNLRDLVIESWLPLTAETGLALHEFDGGVELRVPQYTKGGAVRRIMAEEGPMAVLAYLGDDLTDEDAFRALSTRGLGILVRDEWRPTAARHWLRPPDALLGFLQRWHQAATTPG